MIKPKGSSPRPNRRREVRAQVPHLAHLFTDDRSVGQCVVEDLSVSGMRVVTDAALRKGRRLTVIAELPGRKAMVLQTRVVRTDERRKGENVLGLAFTEIAAADVDRIRKVVLSHLAGSELSLVFFDTQEDGRAKRIIISEEETMIVPDPIASVG
jgi:c-di-GMP-binding flagellar brake protein YcgR